MTSEEMLSFYEKILDTQRVWADRITVESIIPLEKARGKLVNGIPLLEGEAPAIDPEVFREVALTLAEVYRVRGETIDVLIEVDDSANLIKRLMSDQEACLVDITKETGLDREVVLTFFQLALTPFYEKMAVPFRGMIEEVGWKYGFCPVCGATPEMAKLRDTDGQRILLCSFCRTEWAFPRIQCPFCGNTDQNSLRYFYVEGDDGHRVDVCEVCKGYVKTADERLLGRAVGLQEENAVTFQLDLLAEQEGYSNAEWRTGNRE